MAKQRQWYWVLTKTGERFRICAESADIAKALVYESCLVGGELTVVPERVRGNRRKDNPYNVRVLKSHRDGRFYFNDNCYLFRLGYGRPASNADRKQFAIAIGCG